MFKKVLFTLIVFTFILNPLVAKESFIAGKAIYTDGEILPTDAQFEVILEDVSRADTLSEVIASLIKPSGQIPITFKLIFDDENITLGSRYAVRASIKSKDQLLYITDTFNSVFSGADDQNMNLLMKRIAKVPKSRGMEGLYKTLADVALFKDCMTGKYYPVAFEKDNAALERTYLKESNGSAEFIKVELKGKIVKRAKMEGDGEEDVLLVERFIRLLGDKNCNEQQVAVPITNNYWKLKILYGNDVNVEANEREAHILLRKGLNGAGVLKIVTGCSTVMGDYIVNENSIKFNVVSNEEKDSKCQHTELAKNFLSALKNSEYWKIEGESLTLYDEMNNVQAVFKAIYF